LIKCCGRKFERRWASGETDDSGQLCVAKELPCTSGWKMGIEWVIIESTVPNVLGCFMAIETGPWEVQWVNAIERGGFQ
jgi:hypothetical protein